MSKMKASELKALKSKIEEMEKDLLFLRKTLMFNCPHNHIIESCYCDDDYALYKTYTYSYSCLDCEAYSNSDFADDECNKLYEKMKNLYLKQKYKNIIADKTKKNK